MVQMKEDSCRKLVSPRSFVGVTSCVRVIARGLQDLGEEGEGAQGDAGREGLHHSRYEQNFGRVGGDSHCANDCPHETNRVRYDQTRCKHAKSLL